MNDDDDDLYHHPWYRSLSEVVTATGLSPAPFAGPDCCSSDSTTSGAFGGRSYPLPRGAAQGGRALALCG